MKQATYNWLTRTRNIQPIQMTLISCCMHMEQITLILILLINPLANVKPRLAFLPYGNYVTERFSSHLSIAHVHKVGSIVWYK